MTSSDVRFLVQRGSTDLDSDLETIHGITSADIINAGVTSSQTANVRQYGAAGDAVAVGNGTIVSGSPVITFASADLTTAGLTATSAVASMTAGKVAVVGRATQVLQITDGVMSTGSNSKRITSVTGGFTTAMEGRITLVPGAGAGGALLGSSITYVQDTNTAWLASGCSTSVTGATVTVTASMLTSVVSAAAAADGSSVSVTLAAAPTVSATGAGITYGTDDSAAFAAAAAANPGGTVVVPVGKYMLASSLSLNGPICFRGLGWAPASNTSGARLYMPNGGIIVNSTGASRTHVRLENLSLDCVSLGQYALTLGATSGTQKSAQVACTDVSIHRATVAGMRCISTAYCHFERLHIEGCLGAEGILFDAVSGSALNTDMLFDTLVVTGCRMGMKFKEARRMAFVRATFYENHQGAVILEKQASSSFDVRNIVFTDETVFEDNITAGGLSGSGAFVVKTSNLHASTKMVGIAFDHCVFSGEPAGDKQMHLEGGDYQLHWNRYVPTSTNTVIDAAQSATGVATVLNEQTTDTLTPTANLPGGGGTAYHAIGAGVNGTLVRTGGVGHEIWIANAGAYARKQSLTSASSTV